MILIFIFFIISKIISDIKKGSNRIFVYGIDFITLFYKLLVILHIYTYIIKLNKIIYFIKNNNYTII